MGWSQGCGAFGRAPTLHLLASLRSPCYVRRGEKAARRVDRSSWEMAALCLTVNAGNPPLGKGAADLRELHQPEGAGQARRRSRCGRLTPREGPALREAQPREVPPRSAQGAVSRGRPAVPGAGGRDGSAGGEIRDFLQM